MCGVSYSCKLRTTKEYTTSKTLKKIKKLRGAKHYLKHLFDIKKKHHKLHSPNIV